MRVPDPAQPGYEHTRPLPRSSSPAPNPTAVVAARNDKVILGPDGGVLLRIEDRPIGFGRPR